MLELRDAIDDATAKIMVINTCRTHRREHRKLVYQAPLDSKLTDSHMYVIKIVVKYAHEGRCNEIGKKNR